MPAPLRNPLPLDHPDFPHGQLKGYRYGCREESECPGKTPCRTVHARRVKELSLAKHRNGGKPVGRFASPERMAALRAHVDTLLAVPAVVPKQVHDMAGCRSLCAFMDWHHGRLDKLGHRTVDALMALTVEQVYARRPKASRAELVSVIRRMQAAGFPLTWQREQTGHAVELRSGETCPREWLDAYTALLARIERDNITPQDVLGADGVARARAACAATVAKGRHGFYPPEFYHPDGTVNYAAIPGHPIAVANERADDDLQQAATYLRASIGRGARLGADWIVANTPEPQWVKPTRAGEVKRVKNSLTAFLVEHSIGQSFPGHVDRRQHMLAVIEDYERGSYGSPVAVAVALGLWSLTAGWVQGLLLPQRTNGHRPRNAARPTEPHPGIAEAEELTHLHPLVAVPLTADDQEAAA